MKKLLSLFSVLPIIFIFTGCGTTELAALSTLGQLSPHTTPEEKAAWAAIGTASRMVHEKEVAREGRTQVTVNVSASSEAGHENLLKNSDGSLRPAEGYVWVNPNDPNDFNVRRFSKRSPVIPANAARHEIPGSLPWVVIKSSPSVVNIRTMNLVKGRGQLKSQGTGFIIANDGYVVTSNHVIENADEIKIKLSDERDFNAKVIGRDPKTDLALLKIESDSSFVSLPIGNSEELLVGERVLAIGSPYGLGKTLSIGIVTAKYRLQCSYAYGSLFQNDAFINPGNSGGPLLNMAGEVIGINTAIFAEGHGIGFAIPINWAKNLLPQLLTGRVRRGSLGVINQRITLELREKIDFKEEKGALVADVSPEGPADEAGIKQWDVIMTFDGKEVRDPCSLAGLVASTPIGKIVAVEVIRKGQKKDFEVKIGELQHNNNTLILPDKRGYFECNCYDTEI